MQCEIVNTINLVKIEKDLHRDAAAQIFQKEPKEITDEERKIGKLDNYRLQYGGSLNLNKNNRIYLK